MGFNNPDVPWSEIERRLSDRPGGAPAPDPDHDAAGAGPGEGSAGSTARQGSAEEWWAQDPLARRHREPAHPGDGGDSPAWSHHREAYVPPPDLAGSSTDRPTSARSSGHVGYAELHCHSAFSFLDGASQPEALAEEAARLGLEALAVTDHHGFYGVVRFAQAARTLGLPTVFGAELTLNAPEPRPGPADPSGRHLLVLARDPAGYARLAALLSEAQMAGE